jgi:hypothetical protein
MNDTQQAISMACIDRLARESEAAGVQANGMIRMGALIASNAARQTALLPDINKLSAEHALLLYASLVDATFAV